MFLIVIGFILGAYMLIIGLHQMITGKLWGATTEYKRYTEKSIIRVSKITSVVFLAMGVILILKELQKLKGFTLLTPSWWYWVLIGICAIALLLLNAIFLVKLPQEEKKEEEKPPVKTIADKATVEAVEETEEEAEEVVEEVVEEVAEEAAEVVEAVEEAVEEATEEEA